MSPDTSTEKASIEIDRKLFSPDALDGLSEFSHIEVVFYMNKVDSAKIEKGSRQIRNDPKLPKIGILSRRDKNRPNQLGTTVCKILKILNEDEE